MSRASGVDVAKVKLVREGAYSRKEKHRHSWMNLLWKMRENKLQCLSLFAKVELTRVGTTVAYSSWKTEGS
jgi:hypothetical protein